MILAKLQSRIKGSRLFVGKEGRLRRLYLRYGRQSRGYRTQAWIEIINDRLQVRVRVEHDRAQSGYNTSLESQYASHLYKQFHEIINNCELERKQVPLHERLRDDIIPVHEGSMLHQAQALRFCCTMKVSALFADTGTGKSKVAIDLAISRYEAGQINKVLIFCPVSTKKNFRDEIKKWHSGSGLKWNIVGLETMSSSDKTYLETLDDVDNETFVIIDESHKCKTPFARRSKRIKECCNKCSYKLIMTGTPAESVKDLYMQYAMLSDLIIGEPNWLTFEEKYLIVDDRGDIIGYKNVDHLMSLVEPYTYQIRKEDCLDLPDKHFNVISCSLTADQTEIYEATKQELLERLEKFHEKDVQAPATLIFQYFTKLQQIACGFVKDEDGHITDLGSGKFDQLDKTECFDSQTIFFCKYLHEIYLLVKFLGKDQCAVFTGENPNERDAEKDMFTRGEKKFFVATMGSGGTGLNGLQHCNRIVFVSNSFKWTERKQCIGRIDRQGQTRSMYIYDLRAECGIEYRISSNLARKGNLADEIREILHDQTKLKQYVSEL